MNGSKLRRLAWLTTVAIATGFAFIVMRTRGETARLAAALAGNPTTPPPPAIVTPPSVAPPLPTRPTATATEEHAALARLRAEVKLLRQRVADREKLGAASLRGGGTAPTTPSLSEAFLPPHDWQDAGDGSAAAVLETALWAGAGGDVGRLAGLLELGPETRTAADALLARLPADLLPPHADSQALIALMAADSVPLQNAKLAGDFATGDRERTLLLQFEPDTAAAPAAPPQTAAGPNDTPQTPMPRDTFALTPVATARLRNVKLTVRQDPATNAWKLIVPPSAIDRFAQKLGVAPPPASPTY